MKVTKSNLETVEKKYKGYMQGPIVGEFFKEFGIHFAAGHWCAGDFLDRFATTGYAEEGTCDSGIVAQMERVAARGGPSSRRRSERGGTPRRV